ncbi:CRISPR system precrRNA processing endoribonuclease RAMP protein Cas6 [Oribacterium sp. FC2011]|uniref:CRISPR system precrRNA processing endoribonuclease RAMP protein Cas6 n=1 Tax=Oribacterium sp. FC2011 TaxID=1408311 RepID=UPI0004E2058D|nr:CRISPR system precrRNA processing endoribonuclease RAMP protein Cas6 [Oribacterium sp. FC2011]
MKIFNIRYIKLHFNLNITVSSEWPENKVSALRGGMGEMLLRMHCVRSRECENCDFNPDCLVRQMMYSQMKIQPTFMTEGDSAGYVIECEDYSDYFESGDELMFNLLLFGRNIAFFGLYLQAFQYLGMSGIGKDKSKFIVSEVTNSKGKIIFDGTMVHMNALETMSIREYVDYRCKKINGTARLMFHTPLTLKYNSEFLKKFDIEAIMRAIERRVYILNCFEGNDTGRIDLNGHIPLLTDSDVKQSSVSRYSSTHQKVMTFRGIKGYADIEEIDQYAKELLAAGELIHIGKNTSFGFGKYTIMSGGE